MTIHVMLDLETWGTRPGCDIRSIGACVFDPLTGEVSIPCETCKGGSTRGNLNEGGDCSDCMNTRMERGYGDTFYVATENPIEYGQPWSIPQGGSEIKPWKYRYKLTRDPSTVQWWNEQSAEAQAAFANPIDLKIALERFAAWFVDFDNGNYGSRDIRIWANDPHFDVSILAACFLAVGLDEPWHYRAPRSMKTAVELAGMTSDDYSNYGDAHNALHDAIAQAMTVCEAYKRLGLRK